jgi:hypothetical protein
MRQEYSTKWGRRQEASRLRGWFTYGRTGSPPQWGSRILGIGEIRGANAPFAHAGVFGKMEIGKEGKGLIVPSNTKADVADVLIKIIVVPPHRNPAPVFHG